MKYLLIIALVATVLFSCSEKPNRTKLEGKWTGKYIEPKSAAQSKAFKFRDYGSSTLNILSDSILEFSVFIEKDLCTDSKSTGLEGLEYRLIEAGTKYTYSGKYTSDSDVITICRGRGEDTLSLRYAIENNQLNIVTMIDKNQFNIVYE